MHEPTDTGPDDTVSAGEMQANVDALSLEAVQVYSLFLLTIGFAGNLLWLRPLDDLGQQWTVFLTVLSLAAWGLWAYESRRSRPLLARAVLLAGPTVSVSLLLRATCQSQCAWAMALLVIMNSAISVPQGVLAGLLATLSIVVCLPAGPASSSAIALIWVTAAIEWLCARRLRLALDWAWQSHRRSMQLLGALRQRQGELNRTLKALSEAYDTLRRTNSELAVARRDADEARTLKEQFVANVSHEIRTPLNLIVGFSEMMYLNPDSYTGVGWTPELVGDIGRVYRASQYLQSLVNDILDLSRIDAKRLPFYREAVDLRSVVSDAVETFAPLLAQHGLYCHTQWPDDIPVLHVDRTRIRQVILNLLNNALRFTDRGGIDIGISLEQDAVLVSVRDTGVGIPEDKLDLVFQEFSQAHDGLQRRGGAGLGLSICRQFVALHGGRMWAESRVGVGSTFYFTLPLPGSLPQTQPLARRLAQPRADRSDMPIVVVDPDPAIAEMLMRYLDDRIAIPARNADEAEQLVAQHHPLAIVVNQTPDAPTETWHGSLGPLAERYQVPVIRLSIPSGSWLTHSSYVNDCLSKPITRELLAATIRRHVSRPDTILVVDDDPGFVELVRRMLRTAELGGTILSAYSAADALVTARERRPDLVLLDLLMPQKDGFALAQALREEAATQHACIVAITATSYAEELFSHHSGRYSVVQAGGITPGALVELLRATAKHLHPSYNPR